LAAFGTKNSQKVRNKLKLNLFCKKIYQKSQLLKQKKTAFKKGLKSAIKYHIKGKKHRFKAFKNG
jgi:hypothetical protein